MEYRVHITDEKGEGVAGTVYLYDMNGGLIGFASIPAEGGSVAAELVSQASTFHIDAPGFIGYDVLQLSDWNQFTLVRESSSKIVYVVLALVGLVLVGKLLKL